jgi:hypothetical protein
MPWEDVTRSIVGRFGATLGVTFEPGASVARAALGSISPAVVFALLSGLPWAMLWGVVPFTHTLLFGPSFQITVVANVSTPVWLDVGRAVGLGVALSLLSFLSWAVPFASLSAAFLAEQGRAQEARRAAWRSALYRGWVIPCGLALWSLVLWASPAEPSALVIELAIIVCQLAPRLLVLVHCHTLARYLGASYGGALVVSLVPLLVDWAAGMWLSELAKTFLPVQAQAGG